MSFKKNSCPFHKRIGMYFILSIIILSPFVSAFGQSGKAVAFEKAMQTALGKGYGASVFLIDYHTGPLRYLGYRSTGVVVKGEYILTAGHATIIGKKYRVVFPDGKECSAIGVGKITPLDAGMLKIQEEGSWPSAEMGWSSLLAINEPCLTAAYPASFQPKQLSVRYGKVTGIPLSLNIDSVVIKDFSRGRANDYMLRNTCVMEPGDSGGPLFDIDGKLIGIRSRIMDSQEINFDVPIDVFRQYWTALQQGKEFKALPERDADWQTARPEHPYSDVLWDKDMDRTMQQSNSREGDVVLVTSPVDSALKVNGTIISLKKLRAFDPKAKSWLISKSSLVDDHPVVHLNNGEKEEAVVIARDEKRDLVLMALYRYKANGISLDCEFRDSMDTAELGSLLRSPLPAAPAAVGTASTVVFDLPQGSDDKVSFGASFEPISGKLSFVQVVPAGPAAVAGIAEKDEIIALDGQRIEQPAQLMELIMRLKPGDVLPIQVKRGEQTFDYKMLLGKLEPTGNALILERFEGGRSDRKDGFGPIFVHDSKLTPANCGGPVFDIHGDFLGINMARYSRTATVGMLAVQLQSFIDEVLER